MCGIEGVVRTAQVAEDPLNDRRFFDAGDDVQGCTNSAERREARER
jgi:hypothetical protein